MVKRYFTTLKEKIYNGNSKIYLYGLTVLLFWAKTQVAYARTFNSLQVTNFWQHFVILVSPFSFLLIYFAIPFLIKKGKVANLVLVIMQIALSIFLYVFVLYFRAFFDFLSINTILYAPVSQAGALAQTLTIKWYDFIYCFDTFVLVGAIVFFQKKRGSKSAEVAYI